ncbi:transcriptional regulator [Rhizobium rhizosphaerae]|uniref:Transcriptional regulator n=1 Tax=Xaviernesmea rhizosphaerae TaxID=1672749 RepID=A0A1Q9AE05_9HYPH|nr:transcriptional regulator [Xaviernesmea rhizosphaerae]
MDIRRVTIDGRAYVQIAEEDFEDLVDGLQTDVILARIAAGEETWPMELVEELIDTDSRIRTYRNLTVSELAAAAGISQPYLSEIEAVKKTGSVDVLKRIAGVLKVDLDDLVVERDAHQ